MHIFEKNFSELKPMTFMWFLAAVLGNPFYNVMAYLICDSLGFSEELSTNTTQIEVVMYLLIILIIFVIRYVAYRLIYLVKLKDKMNTAFFIEVFAERHKYQLISLGTVFMWAGEVEGNIAGFVYFPLTLLLLFSVSIITLVRMCKMSSYFERKKEQPL